MKLLFAAALLSLVGLSPAHATPKAPQCGETFKEEGNFMTGRQFIASRSFSNVDTATAFQRTYANMAKQGFTINAANEGAGVITAQQPVAGSARVVPFNAVIQAGAQGGADVSLTFSVAPGMAVREADVRGGFCEVFTEVER